MHIIGEIMLQEKNKEIRSDVLGQLMEFKKLQKLKKEQEAKGINVDETKSFTKPKAEEMATSKPMATQDVQASVTTVTTLSEDIDTAPLLCDFRKEYPKIIDKQITAIKATEKYVFLGDNLGFSRKLSISNQVLCQGHGYIHNDSIFCYETSDCGQWVFTSDGEGMLKQWNVDTMELVKNYGRLMDCEIKDIAISGDNVFVGDMYGNLKQISIKEEKVIKDYGKVHKSGIWSVRCTRDGEFLFTTDGYGYLQQWSINNQNCVKNFGYIHDAGIRKIDVSWDSKYLFTADRIGGLKQWDIKTKTEVKDYGKIYDCEILSIKCSSKFLFVSSVKGGMKQYNIETKELVQDFGRIHEGSIHSITVSPNAKWLFTSDDKGNMKQFRINDEYIMKKKVSVFEEIEEIPKKKSIANKVIEQNKVSDVTSIDSKQNFVEEKVVVVDKVVPNVDSNVVSAVKSKVNILERKVDKMEEKMIAMEKKIDAILKLAEKK